MSQATPDPAPPSPIRDLLAHRGRVTALARRLVSAADADDVAQETWLAALRAPPRADGTADRWLLRVARNAALKLRRGSSRRGARDAVAAHARQGVEESPDVVLARAESHRRVVEAVLRLAEPYRSTVLLRWFEDVDVAEIARRHGCPVETVRTRLKRGHAQLRDLLDGGDDDAGDGTARRRAARLQAILLPLVGGDGAATKATTGGLAAMAVGWKLCAAAALVVAGVFLWWSGVSSDGGAQEARSAAAPPPPPGARPGPVRVAAAPRPAGDAVGRESDGSVPLGGDGSVPQTPRLLRVTDDRGVPLADAAATVLGENPEPARAVLGGALRIDPSDSARRVLVVAPGWPPRVVDVPPGDGEFGIVLPGGASVAGVVRIDGLPASEPVVLQFGYADNRDFVGAEAHLAISPFYATGFEPHRAGCVTGEGARFRFEGLPSHGPGGIRIPDWLAFRDRPELLRAEELDVPTDAVLLDLVAFPRLRGRVVSAGAPLAGAFVRVEWTEPDGGRSSRSLAVGRDGEFLRPIECLAPRDVEVVVSDPECRAERTVAVPSPVRGITEVGSIAIEPPQTARVRVVGPDGAPVAGAVVLAAPPGSRKEGTTGADGVLEFGAIGGHASVCVAARGFVSRTATWSVDTAGAPHEVRLAAAPVLTMRYAAGGVATPRSYLRLRIEGPAGLFPAATGPSAAALSAAGASPVIGLSHTPEGETQWYGLTEGALTWAVWDLSPETPCRYAVLDDYGTQVASGEFSLARGERREIEVTPAGTPRTISVSVTDDAGRPVTRAAVRVSDAAPTDEAGPQLCYLPADEDGRAVFEGFRAERVAVRVEAPGRAPWVGPSVAVGADGLTLAVRLLAERRLVVRVADANGRPVAGASVVASPPGAPEAGAAACAWSGEEASPGVHRVAGAAEGALLVVAEMEDGRHGSVEVVPGANEVTVTLRDGD